MPSRDERKIDAQFFPRGQRVEIGWGSRFQRVLFYRTGRNLVRNNHPRSYLLSALHANEWKAINYG